MKLTTKLSFLFILLFSIFLHACQQYENSEITMYYPDSIPKIKVFYKYFGNDLYIAKEIRYHPNGQIESEGGYNNSGLKQGKWQYYFDNGENWLQESYYDGKKHGKVIEWYKSGKKMYQGEYYNDLPDGTWTVWDENGKKMSSEKYDKGSLID